MHIFLQSLQLFDLFYKLYKSAVIHHVICNGVIYCKGMSLERLSLSNVPCPFSQLGHLHTTDVITMCTLHCCVYNLF